MKGYIRVAGYSSSKSISAYVYTQPCHYHRDGSRFIRQITHSLSWSIDETSLKKYQIPPHIKRKIIIITALEYIHIPISSLLNKHLINSKKKKKERKKQMEKYTKNSINPQSRKPLADSRLRGTTGSNRYYRRFITVRSVPRTEPDITSLLKTGERRREGDFRPVSPFEITN